MATLHITPPIGKALIYLHNARRNFEANYNTMMGCRTCDKQQAEEFRAGAEFFSNLIRQLEKQA